MADSLRRHKASLATPTWRTSGLGPDVRLNPDGNGPAPGSASAPRLKAQPRHVDSVIVPPLRSRLPSLTRFFGREALSLVLVAFYAVLLASLAQAELVGDSWLTLVSGREVAQHGLPQHDHLMAFSQGARWVDQQWLAQLAFYGLTRLGGIQAAVILHVILLTGAFGLAVIAARRRGAS